MSCFALEALPSEVKQLSANFISVPMFPEMKMQRGLTNLIDDDNPQIQGLHAMLCHAGLSEGERLLRSLQDEKRRRLRRNNFLGPTMAAGYTKEPFSWRRRLNDIDDTECMELMSNLEVARADEGGQLVTLTFPGIDSRSWPNRCIHALAADLAFHSEVCFVGALLTVTPRNSVASGIVQGGPTDATPFHDVGLDGTGQIVAVSDSGLDVDNCYFFDSSREPVVKDKSKVSIQWHA
jgi:hypothetical protein